LSPAAKPRETGWRTRDILRASAILAGVYVALQLLWFGRTVFLLGFFGVLLGITLSAGVDRLERLRIPRGVGAVGIVFLALGGLIGIGLLTAPQVARQLEELRDQLPQAIDRVELWVQQRGGGVADLLQAETTRQPDTSRGRGDTTGRAGKAQQDGAGQPADLRQGLTQQLAGAGRHFFSVFSSTVAALGGLIVLLFVAIFVAVDPGLYHRGLMHLFPHRMRQKAGEVLSATATTLRRWLFMQMIAMVAIGSVTTVALLLLGVKAAAALGIIAGLLEFIPYVGPILSAVPAIAMALVDGPEKALYVALAYIAIQQLEGMVIQPLLMKEGLELPPVITILGQALSSLVFGFMGLLLAVPLLATAIVPIKMLYVRDVVGDDVSVPGDDAG
jgi:predicted PurR-regulated permease PerM